MEEQVAIPSNGFVLPLLKTLFLLKNPRTFSAIGRCSQRSVFFFARRLNKKDRVAAQSSIRFPTLRYAAAAITTSTLDTALTGPSPRELWPMTA
jgi:hypothetical protein